MIIAILQFLFFISKVKTKPLDDDTECNFYLLKELNIRGAAKDSAKLMGESGFYDTCKYLCVSSKDD